MDGRLLTAMTALLLLISGPGASPGRTQDQSTVEPTLSEAATRAFRMGFTPFPHDISLQALADTRDMLRGNGDLVAAHFEGVPWPEALSGEPFHANLLNEWQRARDALGPAAVIYLAVTPLDLSRSQLAPSRGEREGMPIPEALVDRPLDDPLVVEAYTNYCLRAVDALDPQFLAIGIETNELCHNNRSSWDAYVRLHKHVYETVKQTRPELPVFATFTLHNMLNPDWADRAEVLAEWKQLMPWNDAVAISYYPFLSPGSGDVAAALARLEREFGAFGKPFAVAEMGEPAEPVTLTEPPITLPGSPEQQRAMLEQMLDFAQAHETYFVNWFTSRDYDALWDKIRATSPEFFKLWRDCGLVDGDGAPRPALEVWRSRHARPLALPAPPE